MADEKKPQGKKARKARDRRIERDAEGTVRLPHIQRALEAGLLNAPPPDRPRKWRRRSG